MDKQNISSGINDNEEMINKRP